MAVKRDQIIALGTLLFILAIVVSHFVFSSSLKPNATTPPATTATLPPASTTASPEVLTTPQTVPLLNPIPTNATVTAAIADLNRKKEFLEKRIEKKDKKAATVAAIVRGEIPAPEDPWHKKTTSPNAPNTVVEEKPDSISHEELKAGIKSKKYFIR